MNQFVKRGFVLASSVLALGAGLVVSAENFEASAQEEAIKIAVIGDSTLGIWEVVQENLGDSVKVELFDMLDPVSANRALIEGDVDLAAFQHYAALDQFNADNDTDLTPITETFISPMNILSENVTSVEKLEEGDEIIIPESPTNRGRALKVLEHAGLITLSEDAGPSPEITDIADNPLKLEITEVDQAFIMTALGDVAAGLTVANNVIDVGVDPVDDAIYVIDINPEEESLKPYVNLITTLPENAAKEEFQTILDAYHQDNVKNHIIEEYNNAMIPVWE